MVHILNQQIKQRKVILSRGTLKLLPTHTLPLPTITLLSIQPLIPRRKPSRQNTRLQSNVIRNSKQQLHKPPLHILRMLICPPHEINQRPRKQPVVNDAIDLRIDQGVEEDSRAAQRVVVVTGERELGDCYEDLGGGGILETGMGCWATGFIAEDGV